MEINTLDLLSHLAPSYWRQTNGKNFECQTFANIVIQSPTKISTEPLIILTFLLHVWAKNTFLTLTLFCKQIRCLSVPKYKNMDTLDWPFTGKKNSPWLFSEFTVKSCKLSIIHGGKLKFCHESLKDYSFSPWVH